MLWVEAKANVIQRLDYQHYQVVHYHYREVSRPNMGCSYSGNMGVSRIFHYQLFKSPDTNDLSLIYL